MTKQAQSYRLALLISVWQHVPNEDKLTSLVNLYSLLEQNGKLIISVRNGAGTPNRKCFPTSAKETIDLAQQCGFILRFNCNAASNQTSNKIAKVTWDWLVFERT